MSEQVQQQSADREIEDQAYINFETVYVKLNQRPEFNRRNLLEALDIDFWIGIIQSVASVGLSAMRTGAAFYAAGAHIPFVSELTAKRLGVVEAGLAVLAYELALLSFGLTDGRKNRRLHGWFKWPLMVLIMATVIIAGYWQSTLISDKLAQNTDGSLVVLSIFMAGASILAFASGEILGQAWGTAQDVLAQAKQDYHQACVQWEDEKQGAWEKERARYILRVRNARKKEEERNQVQAQPEPRPGNSMQKVSVLINEYFAKRGIDPLVDQVSPQVIAQELTRLSGQDIKENTVTVHVRRLRARANSNGGGQS